jgi:hypothetical protein
MEASTVAALILAWAAVLLCWAAIFLAPTLILARIRAGLNKATADIAPLISTLIAERARAAGTIGSAVRRGTMIPAQQVVPPVVAAVANGLVDHAMAAGGGAEIEIPDWLVNVARGAGIDVGKILAGDPGELAKAKGVLAAVRGNLPNNQAVAPMGPKNGFMPGEFQGHL